MFSKLSKQKLLLPDILYVLVYRHLPSFQVLKFKI